jgi:hypothetical protein
MHASYSRDWERNWTAGTERQLQQIIFDASACLPDRRFEQVVLRNKHARAPICLKLLSVGLDGNRA